MKISKNSNPKNMFIQKVRLNRIFRNITRIIAQVNAAARTRILDLRTRKERPMKKIILILLPMIVFNLAMADENAPVNFHKDKHLGQYNFTIKTTEGGRSDVPVNLKICFVAGGKMDQSALGKFEEGCVGKKLKDTQAELEYLVECNGKPRVNIAWRRLSETDFSNTSKVGETSIESTYRYMGPSCDSDAVKQ